MSTIIKPDWWLRMRCGQLGEEVTLTRAPRMAQVFRAQFRQLVHILGRAETGGVARWTLWLTSKSLPDEPPWKIRARV